MSATRLPGADTAIEGRMMPEQYVFLTAAAALLLLWLVLLAGLPRQRGLMLRAGLISAPFGLAEPLFMPRHWAPPTLFGLGELTGFSLESVLFCFARAGAGVALYDLVTNRMAAAVCPPAVRRSLNPAQAAALASPLLLFVPLYFLPWDPVVAATFALLAGAGVLLLRQPAGGGRAALGGLFFVLHQALFFAFLEHLSSGYLRRVLSPAARSGPWWLGMPAEDLLFAGAFGLYWFAVYEYYGCFRPLAGAEDAAWRR